MKTSFDIRQTVVEILKKFDRFDPQTDFARWAATIALSPDAARILVKSLNRGVQDLGFAKSIETPPLESVY